MHPAEKNNESENIKFFVIVKSCKKCQYYVKNALHQIQMITNYCNLKKKLNKNLNQREIK